MNIPPIDNYATLGINNKRQIDRRLGIMLQEQLNPIFDFAFPAGTDVLLRGFSFVYTKPPQDQAIYWEALFHLSQSLQTYWRMVYEDGIPYENCLSESSPDWNFDTW